MLYKDIQAALNYTLSQASITNEETGRILELLETTSGVLPDSSKVYRPYYVIGLELWLKPENNLISGEGAKLDQNFETARRYFSMQYITDKNFNVTVSEQFKADIALTMVNNACDTCTATIPGKPFISIMSF